MSNQWVWPGSMNGERCWPSAAGSGMRRYTPSGMTATFRPMAWQCSSSAMASSGVCIGMIPATVRSWENSRYASA